MSTRIQFCNIARKLVLGIVLLFTLVGCGDGQQIQPSSITDTSFEFIGDSRDPSPVMLRIPKQLLNNQNMIFARSCTAGFGCYCGETLYPATAIRLQVKANQLLLTTAAQDQQTLARWQIVDSDDEFVVVLPEIDGKEAFYDSNTNVYQPGDIQHRYFHGLRQEGSNYWFNETVYFQTKDKETGQSTSVAMTSTLYLIHENPSANFFSQKPVPEIGFFVTYQTESDAMIYTGQENFNPKNLNIIKWHNRRNIEWVVSQSVPKDFREYIFTGISRWSEVLPAGMSLSIRMAQVDEDLASPFINPVYYDPDPKPEGYGAAAPIFLPNTGEIFRAALVFRGPKIKMDDFGEQLISTVSHEVGHALGLRHNYKGSLYVADLENFPGGSSIMEYAEKPASRRIGPYDRDAIRWAYEDNGMTTSLPFCSEEQMGKDPFCMPDDVTAENPFERYYQAVSKDVTKELSQVLLKGKKSPIVLMSVYLRKPDAPFYNAQRNASLNHLIELFLAEANTPNEETARILWSAALGVWTIPDMILTLNTFLSPGEPLLLEPVNITAMLPATAKFIQWLGSTQAGSEENFKLRAQLVEKVAALGVSTPRLDLVFELKDALTHGLSGDPALAAENTDLLRRYF